MTRTFEISILPLDTFLTWVYFKSFFSQKLWLFVICLTIFFKQCEYSTWQWLCPVWKEWLLNEGLPHFNTRNLTNACVVLRFRLMWKLEVHFPRPKPELLCQGFKILTMFTCLSSYSLSSMFQLQNDISVTFSLKPWWRPIANSLQNLFLLSYSSISLENKSNASRYNLTFVPSDLFRQGWMLATYRLNEVLLFT